MKIEIPLNAVKGDFDGDGSTEYVWLVSPKFPTEQDEQRDRGCEGNCECYLKFSNKNIPTIKLENCIGGTPVNEGDLNDNNADEIGVLPNWWTSCWRSYQVFTLLNSKWEHIVNPIRTHCNQWEAGVDAIRNDTSKPGHVIIQSSFHTGEAILTMSKSVILKR